MELRNRTITERNGWKEFEISILNLTWNLDQSELMN